MAVSPRLTSLWRSLAGPFIVASSILATSPVLAADAGADRIAAAGRLYLDGKTVSAREALERLVDAPDMSDPTLRVAALGTLLDVCFRTEAKACVAKYVQPYLDAANAAPAANDLIRREQIRRADYYLSYGRYLLGSEKVQAGILDGEAWRRENPSNVSLYLQRQVLAANILLARERPADAVGRIDKILSLIASLKNPEADRYSVARALADAIAILLDVGDTERAYGLYRVGHRFIAQTLPPTSLDAVDYRLAQARLLQQVGDLKGAAEAIDIAFATLQGLELDPDLRTGYLSQTLTLKVVLCGARSDMACAREALGRHPYAERYASAVPTGLSYDEVGYLAARAFVGALDGRSDPGVVAALKSPVAETDARLAPTTELYRLAGLAFATPPGEDRRKALQAAGAQLALIANRPSAMFGVWMRPGAIDQILVAIALTEPDASNAEANFALFQLAARSGPSFDADALAALGRATTTLERRAIHQALRLRARRDRFERDRIQAVALRAMAATPGGAPPSHDVTTRLILRAFNEEIEQAGRGAATGGANLTSLKRFQALLKPNEAALSVALAPDGLAYMCVRKDAVTYARGAVDLARARIDTRLLQLALTSISAPDETLDAQFPVAAAINLYNVYVRPFEPCLKPGDHILWLSSVSALNLPLSVLLDHAPPAKTVGYDLEEADWLIRRYSISYAGSAAMVAATRAGGARAPAAFDFLGVGDPVLTGGAGRRGADLAALPPLPETREELEGSAKGFANARLLLAEDASEGSLRRELLGSYRYLSFATHGLMRDDIEALAEPALVMTSGSADNPTDDGLLTASEIADLNLQARFVALSACNTANFDQSQIAQDLPALASAFAVAGSPATLATLWPVNSVTGGRVVAATFQALQARGGAPAEALAAAQRAFLADPPGPAYRHPRFWAPFVILGDGGAPPPDVAGDGAPIVSVEAVTRDSGEIIGLSRSGDGLTARFIGDSDPTGANSAGIRFAGPDGREAWRSAMKGTGAVGFLATFDGRPLAGGYRRTAEGRFIPTLDLYGKSGGDPARTWRGDAVSANDAILLGGVQTGPDAAVFVVGEPSLRGAVAGRSAQLHVMRVDAALAPRTLVAFDLPAGMSVTQATAAPFGRDLLLTYTDRAMAPAKPPVATQDDYDDPLCLTEPVTRVELRDGRTGVLRQMRELHGYVVTVSSAARDGGVLLGGSYSAGCGKPAKGVVLSVDAELATRQIYRDATLGVSEVRAMKSIANGRTLVAANKENVVNYRVAGARSDIYAMTDLQRTYSGMLLILDRDGKVSAPTMLDTGLNVFLSAAETDGPGRLVVGGSVGGGAALVRLREPRAAR